MNGYILNCVYSEDNPDLTARNPMDRTSCLHIAVVGPPEHLSYNREYFIWQIPIEWQKTRKLSFAMSRIRFPIKPESSPIRQATPCAKTADQVNRSAKDGFKAAKHFVGAAQQYVDDSGLADIDVAEIVKRDPWIALGVAFAVGYVAAQVVRRLSN